MIGGTERLLEVRRAVLADRQKTIGKAEALLLTNAIQPLAKGNRDRSCHALAKGLHAGRQAEQLEARRNVRQSFQLQRSRRNGSRCSKSVHGVALRPEPSGSR